MFKPRLIAATALLAFLAGCSTGSRRSAQDSSPRESKPSRPAVPPPETVERVPEEPRLAPPPGSTPESARAHPANYADTWIPLARWSRENGWGSLRRIAHGPEPDFALSTSNGVFLVEANSRVANWSGLEVLLGFDPQLIDDQPFVHWLDLKKNLEPLLGEPVPAISNRVVVIDPGHGGQNTGAVSVTDGSCEKQFTLDWARRLEALLASEGWQVFLTRTNDIDVSLADRVAFAERHHAGLFVSLHFNSAAPSQEQSGLETYCLTPAGMPSTLTRGYEDDPAAVFVNNNFDEENLQYAVLLHRSLLAVVGVDRGVRRARFLGVLRGQNCPAVLVEGGYLSNPREARNIADPGYRQKLAEAMAAALGGPGEHAPAPGAQPPSNSAAAAAGSGGKIVPAAAPEIAGRIPATDAPILNHIPDNSAVH